MKDLREYPTPRTDAARKRMVTHIVCAELERENAALREALRNSLRHSQDSRCAACQDARDILAATEPK